MMAPPPMPSAPSLRAPRRPLIARSTFVDKQDARKYLEANGVDTITWGVGTAKHVADLLAELRSGDCSLAFMGNKLCRLVGVVKLIIRSSDKELSDHHLMCYEQQLANGRRRPRNVLLSEKKPPEESAQRAAFRAVKEELGSDGNLNMGKTKLLVDTHKNWVETVDSPSYPHLSTRYDLHQFEMVVPGLASKDFSTTEAVEGGGKKIHYWRWVCDSDDDLRYKGPSLPPPELEQTVSAIVDPSAAVAASSIDDATSWGCGVATCRFVNSPIGSAVYWPASPTMSPRRWHPMRSTWVPPPARDHVPWAPCTPTSRVRRLEPPLQLEAISCDPSHGSRSCTTDMAVRPIYNASHDLLRSLQDTWETLSGGTPAIEAQTPRTLAFDAASPAQGPSPSRPGSPRGQRVDLRRATSPPRAALSFRSADNSPSPPPMPRLLYIRATGIDESSTDNGNLVPRTAKARASRLAVQCNRLPRR